MSASTKVVNAQINRERYNDADRFMTTFLNIPDEKSFLLKRKESFRAICNNAFLKIDFA